MAPFTLTPITTRKPGPFAGLLRVCAKRGCITHLNAFNESNRCHAHRQPVEASLQEQLESFEDLMAEAA